MAVIDGPDDDDLVGTTANDKAGTGRMAALRALI